MKILLAGDWRFDIYEAALAEGLIQNGHEVVPFRWGEQIVSARGWRATGAALQRRLRAGPLIAHINDALVDAAVACSPFAVFVFRGDLILPSTFRALRRRVPEIVLAVYNNDDPFAPVQPRHRFRHFRKALPDVDIAFAYRPGNLEDFRRVGARQAALLPPWYVPRLDRPLVLSGEDLTKFGCDVVFAGHYEPDGRMEMLEAVANAGHRLQLFGTGWPEREVPPVLAPLFPVQPVRDDDYRRALAASKIALVFLSRANRDRYTRRNFEIPATGTFMLSEYTSELAEMFEPGVHADYFHDRDELLAKIGYYLAHDDERRHIAKAGCARVAEEGHDVVSRARTVVDALERIRCRVDA